MNLAFYYHIPASKKKNTLILPGYLGLFVDALANNVEKLYLIAHTSEDAKDYILKSPNIELIDLGLKTNSVHRAVFFKKVLKPVFKTLHDIDAFLIRSPSPLAPAFSRFRKYDKPVFYYIVGDYAHGANNMKIMSPRDLAIKWFLKWNHNAFMEVIKKRKVIINSPGLQQGISKFASKTFIVPSSTLTESDFLRVKEQNRSEVTKVLYTGRFDVQKGLIELTNAIYKLQNAGFNIELHLVGWDDNPTKPVENQIKDLSEELGISDNVVFHGKKQVGKQLNQIYRMADIYCIPSYHEGFPRTIWEAMANRLPVIATRVGGIPYFLEDGKDALLIEPKSTEEIIEALQQILRDKTLAQSLIENGFKKASENTVEKRAKELIEYLDENT